MNRRNFIMGGVLCASAGLAYARQPKLQPSIVKKGEFETLIPKQIGPWTFETSSGLVLPPPDALSDRLYDELLTRVYVSPSLPPMMFLIAYSGKQDGLLQVHRPETCYPFGGYTLTETKIRPLALPSGREFAVRSFTAQNPTRTENVLYWTRLGDDFPASWLDQRLSVMKANIAGVIPDGILVRVSTVLPPGENATPLLEQFVRELADAVKPKSAKLLFGGAT